MAARMSPPVAKNAPIGPGSVQGALTTTRPTKPNEVANHAITPEIMGTRIKGMARVRFKTMGAPKINGSLMLKMAGRKPIFPRSLAS